MALSVGPGPVGGDSVTHLPPGRKQAVSILREALVTDGGRDGKGGCVTINQPVI